jgi:hypothetical protein
MKEFDGITGIWTYNDVPEKNEFVLIANGIYQDNASEEGRSKSKDELIKKGEKMRSDRYSFLRIYNEKKQIVWDAFLPTTLSPEIEEYDQEYLNEITKTQ